MRASGTVCWLCGGLIDRDAPPRSKFSAAADHVVPLSAIDLSTAAGRERALDPRLLRLAHVSCNAKRRESIVKAARRTSRDW